MTFDTPARVCSDWTQYAIYDSKINLSTLQNQTGADLVYVWNASSQNWVFFTAGLTSNGGLTVGKSTIFHAVHLFENTNSTWFRNVTNPGNYNYNLTSVSNWVSISTHLNFGNLSYTFQNASGTTGTENSGHYPSVINLTSGDNRNGGTNGTKFGPFNITFFAGYNNSKQDYVSHLFNFTWANLTILEPCPTRVNKDTCMEVLWVATSFNVTWNGTTIYANFTRVG